MIPEQFVILSAILSLIGGSTYIKETLLGNTKPNKISWFLWGAAPLLAFFIQRSEGVGWSNMLTFMVGFIPLLVFIASFVNKQSYWKITRFDVICGLLSVVGLLLWLIQKDAVSAVLFLILADVLAAVPTLQKSLKYPETENYKTFFIGIIGSGIVLLSLQKYSFLYIGFPLYIFVIDTILFLFIYPPTNLFLKKCLKVN